MSKKEAAAAAAAAAEAAEAAAAAGWSGRGNLVWSHGQVFIYYLFIFTKVIQPSVVTGAQKKKGSAVLSLSLPSPWQHQEEPGGGGGGGGGGGDDDDDDDGKGTNSQQCSIQ